MPERNLTIDQYLELLVKGNQRWKSGKSTNWIGEISTEDLVQAQAPFAIVVACADSRVVPEFIFDTVLGELFVIRIAGNIITSEVEASIEYAVSQLGTKLVIVLGHQNCGAVTAKVDALKSNNKAATPNLDKMLGQIEVASKDANLVDHIKANTIHQAAEVFRQSELLQLANEDDQFGVKSAYYRLDQKEVEFLT